MHHILQVFMNNDDSAEDVFSDSKPTDLYNSTINEEVDISLTKNFVKRSISQNSKMNINKETIHSRKKRILYRRSKSQGDAPSLMSGFWNWQLEIGTWREIGLEIHKKRRKRRREYSKCQRNMIASRPKSNANFDRFTLNFLDVSSATAKNTSGKNILTNIESWKNAYGMFVMIRIKPITFLLMIQYKCSKLI